MNVKLYKIYGRILVAVVASLVVVSYAVPTMAEESYVSDARDKLARGVVNGVSG
jgi:hypothetical protein